MKKILKQLSKFSEELMESMVSLISIIFFSSFKTNKFFKLEKKKRKEGDACYILCNSPSLQSVLENEMIPEHNVCVVNFFGNSDSFTKVKPDYYFVLDNILVGRATKERMEKVKEPVNKLYNNLMNVTWPMTLFFPCDGNKKIIRKLKANPNISVTLFNKTPVSGFKGLSYFLYRLNLGMPRPQNISNAAIFCAINAGFKKIYLYGVEHSWQKSFDVDPETHRIYANDGHFYKKENIRYYKRGDYCRVLLNHHLVFKSHFMLREYANYLNVKIVNKTANSFIEAYEFEEY